jgi:hypothetical protein
MKIFFCYRGLRDTWCGRPDIRSSDQRSFGGIFSIIIGYRQFILSIIFITSSLPIFETKQIERFNLNHPIGPETPACRRYTPTHQHLVLKLQPEFLLKAELTEVFSKELAERKISVKSHIDNCDPFSSMI